MEISKNLDNHFNNEDPFDKPKNNRPLGITILAILEIIGTFILIIYFLVIPFLFEKLLIDFYGLPLLDLIYIYSMIMIPISLILAFGLLKGREWARFTSVLFQISSIMTSLLRWNILGLIIPIYIIIYLNKPHVKIFFKTERGISNNLKLVIILLFIILLIFNGLVAFLTIFK